jgi:hypothetical protein
MAMLPLLLFLNDTTLEVFLWHFRVHVLWDLLATYQQDIQLDTLEATHFSNLGRHGDGNENVVRAGVIGFRRTESVVPITYLAAEAVWTWQPTHLGYSLRFDMWSTLIRSTRRAPAGLQGAGGVCGGCRAIPMSSKIWPGHSRRFKMWRACRDIPMSRKIWPGHFLTSPTVQRREERAARGSASPSNTGRGRML